MWTQSLARVLATLSVVAAVRCWVLRNGAVLYGQLAAVGEAPCPGRARSAADDSLQLEDLISRREVQEVRVSPDGQRVAFVVKQAELQADRYDYRLFIVGTRARPVPVKLVASTSSLSNVRWSPDGRWITYLSAKSGSVQLWRIDREGEAEAQVFHHSPGKARHLVDNYLPPGGDDQEAGVFAYEWSPHGGQIAFTTAVTLTPAQRTRMEATGVVYDDQTMTYSDLMTRTWVRHPTELWVYDVRSGRKSALWKVDGDIPGIAWSPDERQIAVSYTAPPVLQESAVFFNQDVGIVSTTGATFSPLSTGEAYEAEPAWSPDGHWLAFVSVLGLTTSSIAIVNPATRERKTVGHGRVGQWISELGWAADGQHLWFEAPDSGTVRRGKSAIYRVGVADDSIAEVSARVGHLSGCSVAAAAQIAACTWQDPMRPPEPAVVDLRTGTVRAIARLNPELEGKPRGDVTELRWTNRYGDETNGFLVKPVGYVKGTQYPTLVVLYWFEGRFIGEAEWITSYPAQLFARDGYALLLVNYPQFTQWRGKDFAAGAHSQGYSPLASIERGVDLLVEAGIADSTRLGILGWSYGAFLAEFTLTKSRRFKVASVGAGGDLNPGAYWLLGRKAFREGYERFMGGPPYGETLRNWVEFSPAFNAHRVEAPVLMEFSAVEGLIGLEMSAALRRHGVPVEFVVYPDEGHVLTRPQHRYHSMQRNLDWFNFWLQGREDSTADRRTQYERWRAMKDALQARLARAGAAAGAVGAAVPAP